MRWIFATFVLVAVMGCGGNSAETVADGDELAGYLAENPSPEVADPDDADLNSAE
ncbi:hypothetical protein [Neorhodopirellula pilleata]|uniref:Secreted protein n=1 Tax=Neorhodopirellula pilleata TaxID=2714738 RepID=A0A5C5ZQJ2_9BACT|nr:hypothetical protein [Neorhodopirellula pilleata]TWT89530.1 hypothetical protein Pla100_54590 [Neorhodopirellula pilleata]